MVTQNRVTDEEKQALRAAFGAAQAASDALLEIQRRLATKYELRGSDTMDAFGWITRDPTLTR